MEVRQTLGGRYKLLDELGRGGMAVVWRARDEVLGRTVAVKLLAIKLVGDPQSRARIRDEARAAATLSHPNIAQVYDYGEAIEDGLPVPYVVMELVNGPTLQQRVAAGPLPPRTVFRICGEVAAALAAAHLDGLVHRDIKMANIMVTAGGAKVVDFGIAAAAGPAAPDEMLVGTPAYLAPERLTGAAIVPASDVYALGVLLYRLLAKESPWSVDTTTQMLRAHIYVEPAPLPPLAGVPPAVADLISRCLQKDPSARPSASEVSTALADAAETPDPVRGEAAPPPRLPTPADAFEADTSQRSPAAEAPKSAWGRRRRAAAAGGAAAAAGAGGVAGMGGSASPAGAAGAGGEVPALGDPAGRNPAFDGGSGGGRRGFGGSGDESPALDGAAGGPPALGGSSGAPAAPPSGSAEGSPALGGAGSGADSDAAVSGGRGAEDAVGTGSAADGGMAVAGRGGGKRSAGGRRSTGGDPPDAAAAGGASVAGRSGLGDQPGPGADPVPGSDGKRSANAGPGGDLGGPERNAGPGRDGGPRRGSRAARVGRNRRASGVAETLPGMLLETPQRHERAQTGGDSAPRVRRNERADPPPQRGFGAGPPRGARRHRGDLKRKAVLAGAAVAIIVAALTGWFLAGSAHKAKPGSGAEGAVSAAPATGGALPETPIATGPAGPTEPGGGAILGPGQPPSAGTGSGATTVGPGAPAQASPTTADDGSPRATGSPAASAAPPGKKLTSKGGSVYATCGGGKATLNSWSPAQGYSVQKVNPGPALAPVIVFAGPAKYRMTVTCVAGTPTPVVLPL